MKKLLIASLILITVAASAQDFRIGVKGTFYSTWLFNNNVSDQGSMVDYAATFGAGFGLTSQYFFNENIGLSIDVLYSSNNQKLEGDLATDLTYESHTKVKYIDLPVLLKISSEGGAYVEFGPQVSFLAGAKEDFKSSPSLPADYSDRDVKQFFSGFGVAPVLGFGVDIQASDNWLVNIGLRFGYGVNDATIKFSEEKLNDVPADEGSWFAGWAHYNADTPPKYSYQKTNRAFGGFTLGIVYKPGR